MVRFKYRYFALEVKPHRNMNESNILEHVSPTNLYNEIRNKINELHGDFGVATADNGLYLKYVNKRTHVFVIRVLHGPHRFLASSLPFINRLGKDSVTIHTLYMGATMRQCFLFIQKYQKQKLMEIWPLLTTNEARKKAEEAFMNIRSIGQDTVEGISAV